MVALFIVQIVSFESDVIDYGTYEIVFDFKILSFPDTFSNLVVDIRLLDRLLCSFKHIFICKSSTDYFLSLACKKLPA